MITEKVILEISHDKKITQQDLNSIQELIMNSYNNNWIVSVYKEDK